MKCVCVCLRAKQGASTVGLGHRVPLESEDVSYLLLSRYQESLVQQEQGKDVLNQVTDNSSWIHGKKQLNKFQLATPEIQQNDATYCIYKLVTL